MTFKDLKKRVSLEATTTQQQSKLAETLHSKPFWIWDIQEHKQEDVITNGLCCFNHIIGLPDKYKNNKYAHFGYDEDARYHFIRWLDVDSSQPAQSMLHYMTGFHNLIRKWDNLSLLDDVNLIVIKQHSIFQVSPRQRPHFERHRIK